MQIESSSLARKVRFSDIQIGEPFAPGDNCIWMAIPDVKYCDEVANAVCLNYGNLEYYDDNVMVSRVDARIVVNGMEN